MRASIVGAFIFGMACVQGALGIDAPSMVFYVPFPEADALAALTAIQPGNGGSIPNPVNPMFTAISIAAIADGTIIYYDQWEDGYELAHDYASPQQATTQIWGDGNTANGFPPGIPSDLINAGTVILLTNNVTSTSPLTIDYDARDKIASTRTISVTRTYWATGSGTLFAGCVETFDTGMWGTEYRAPIGTNIADNVDGQMFEYTAFSISAARDNTTVQIDADNNGTFETTVVLNEGQTHFVSGVCVGGRVLADKPVQVIIFSGDIGSNYESRDSSLLPVSRWSNNYYSPVSTPSANGTRVWLYNPGASAITVSNSYRVGTDSLSGGSVSVGAGTVANVTLTENAAYRFFTANGSPFYAYSTTDSTDTTNFGNQAYDWSFTLIPQQLLSPQVIVGLGIGRDPTSPTLPTENGNPIWVTPVGNGSTSVVVYVDYDGDNVGSYSDPYGNKYDYSTNLVELQQAKLYDPDGDQTAMLIYVLSTNVSLAAAWGQDPLKASTGAPGLDVGTSIPPVEVVDTAKNMTVIGDTDGDGQLGPGERARYTIRLGNAGRAPIPADFIVKDALPTNTTYVAGSTYYRTSTNGTWGAVADDGSGTAFPLDVGGYRIQSILPVKGTFEVRFDVDVVSYANLTAGTVSIVNTGTVQSVVYNRTLTFLNESELHGSLGDRVWNDANGNGQQDAGEVGINGVIVYLDVNTNGVRDANEPYDTTAGDGGYLLTGTYIEAGTHQVRIDRSTLSSNYVATYDLDGAGSVEVASVVLAGGQDRLDVDFGYRLPAHLGDFVWVDTNGNGQQDGGEPGLSNVVVRLYSTNTVVMATVTSTVSGAYAFTNLPPGNYTVSFTPPVNYLFTTSNVGGEAGDSDPLTGTNRTASVALIGGLTNLTVDAGFYLPASLAGFVRVDLNGNGIAETGDTNGIASVTVQLLNVNSNVVATTTTAANGSFSFTNLAPGEYTVREIDLNGWYSTTDISAPNDSLIPATLTSGQSSTGNNFHDTQRAALGNFAWIDTNGNGQQDGGELGLSNVVVRLYDTNSVVVGVATSSVAGAYAFTNLPAGGYTVGFTPPPSYLFTTSNVGADASDSDPLAGTNRTAVVTLTSGQTDNTADAGFYLGASLSGFVRVDANGNGVVEAADTNGIAGATVQLLNAASNVVATTATAAEGLYSFANLYPGVYTVRETDLGGWYSTTDISAPNDNLIPVTLVIGQVSTGNNFHDTQQAALGNLVWVDTNGNGQQDGGELGLSNVVVRLYDTNSVILATTTSTVSGAYAFTNLSAGTYTVGFTPPANYLFTTSNVGADASDSDPLTGTNRTANIALVSGQTDSTVDAGFILGASLSGFVRVDLNGNGMVEAADTNGIVGVTVQLLNAASNVVATTTTAAEGSYSFANLYPGSYTVRETDLTGWYSTADISAPNDNLIPVTLAIGQVSTGNMFHDAQRAAIGDFVWVDTNGNGQQDGGELGLSNVVVRLYDTNSVVMATVTSMVSGAYAFTNLMARAYTVGFTPPSGYLFTTSNVGTDASDSDPLTGTNRTAEVTLVSGQTDNMVDAGFYLPASLSGFVRVDLNGNGAVEAGDTNGITGVTVQLLDASSNRVATTTTVAGGSYSFTGLFPGGYTVREIDLNGWYSTADISAPNDNLIPVTLTSGQSSTGNNFHDTQQAAIGDFVWLDANGNGQQDGGEFGLSNVVVRLYDTNSVILATTTSTVSGAYAFTNLATGAYAVGFTPPANYLFTTSNVGSDASDSDPLAGTNRTAAVTLASGQNDNTSDAGFIPAASLAGFVRIDVNGNGVVEAGDTNGIAEVTVQLLNAASNVVATAATAADGSYSFTNLYPGVYRVRETDLGGWYSTTDITVPNDNLIPVTLAIGQVSTGNNFHDTQQAALGNLVWVDTNGNGQQDGGELGLSNVVVRLYANNVVMATVTSTVSGAYAFTNLAAGTYTVGFTPPPGYLFTVSTAGGNNATDSDPLAGTNRTADVTLASGQTDNTVDAGFYQIASFSGAVRVDVDGDGVIDAEDTVGIAGVTVRLLDVASNAVAAATTTVSGDYAFADVAPGSYTVVQSLPAGYSNTVDVVAPNDLRIPRTLTSGQNSTGNDFYDTRTGSATAQNKVLYLSDPSQALDRINPAAVNDNTTAVTANLGPVTLTNTVTVNATTSGSFTTTGASPAISHVTGTGTNRLMLVTLGLRRSANGTNQRTASAMTYGGVTMTQVGGWNATTANGNQTRTEIWRLLNPASGANTLSFTVSGSANVVYGITTFNNVDQSTPLGTAVAGIVGTGTSLSVTVTNAPAGGLVYGGQSANASAATANIITATDTASQTVLWNTNSSAAAANYRLTGSAGVNDGGGNVAVSWSYNAASYAALAAVAIRPSVTVGNITTATFTQEPAFELPFNMASGATVLITNYVNVTSGSMPVNPAITALLSVGGSTFLTLSNPTYDSGNGTLVWSGSLGGAVALSAGQAVSLSVSNAQSGVALQIRYDSATYPSKIILPTASIIAVPSVGVYDAAYPGGTPVTSSPITAQRYVRATVTDPFGAYDIAGAGLVIDGPGTSGDVSASLADAHVVSSNAWSKTYEYVWQTVALSGGYSLTVTANEGSEGITASGTTAEILYAASIGDRVWNDLNGNGVQEAFEPGIAGVRVYVDSNGSGTYTVGEPAAETAADGSYQIGSLLAGSCTARVDTVTLPAGMSQTCDLNGALDHAAAVVLASNQTRTDVDFGYRSMAVYTIRGQVRDDFRMSGNLNDPDNPVGGVLVSLYTDPNGDGNPSDGAALGAMRTTSDGRYAFTNVLSGAYVVVETDPSYSFSTADRVGPNDNRIPVVIVDADSVSNDFLDAVDPTGYLYDVADGRTVPGGSISVTGPGAYVLMDGSSGQFMFIATNNAAGSYTIAVTPPPGYMVDPARPAHVGSFDPTGGATPSVLGSYESAGTPGYLVNYSAASNTYYYTFDLAPGDPPVINNNFPLTKVVIEIAGTVFYDQNRLTDNTVNGTGTNAAGLFANLVNPATHVVIAGVSVATNGAYRFAEADGVVTNTAYEVILTRASQAVGATLTNATLITGWVSTGEHVGAGTGSDGTVDSRLLVSTTADGVREVNFGLDRVPDITPVITAVPNVMHAIQRFNITVRTTELNLVDTAGLITIRIPKDIRWVLDGAYDPALTVLSGTALNNSAWAYSEDATNHIFKSTAVIPAGGFSYFGFKAIWNAGQTRGRYTITSQIDSWSGGEDRIDNNVDAEKLDYFIY